MINIKGVTQRGENTYRFTVSAGFDGNGKHIRKTTTFKVPPGTAPTKAEKLVQKAYVAFSDKCKENNSFNDNMRFKELVELYFKDFAPNELKPATIYNYDKDLKARILPVFGNKKISEIKVAHMSRFFTGLDLAPETTRKLKTIASSVFSYGVEQGYISSNPCVGALYKKDNSTVKKVKCYDKEQCKKLLELTSEYSVFNTIIQILLFTGLRCGECLSLQWKNINFEYNIINIENTLTYANKKWFLTTPKTKNSLRTIKINDYTKQLLLTHKEKQDEAKKIVDSAWLQPELVFTSSTGNFYDRSLLNTQFRRFLKKNNMPKITIHGLRHTNASLMINNDISLKAVSSHLGHCNIKVTGDIYGHIFKEYEAKIADAIEQDLIG